MNKKIFAYAVGIGLMATGMTFAWHGEKKHGSVKSVTSIDIVETIAGKESTATAVEVTLMPGEAGDPHRHPGPTFGYVLEGEYEWAIDDHPSKVLKVGETFYEPAGCLHRVSKNPGRANTRVIAWVLHPRDVKEIVIPEKK